MSKGFIIGIDLGGTNLKIALLDLKYRIRDKKVLTTRAFRSPQKLISAIVYSVNTILADNRLTKERILGVGMGLPGPIDRDKGVAHFFPNIPGFRELSLRKILRQKLNLPVFLDNDAKLMTQGEYKLGNASGFRNVLCLTLGTGVGGGIIISGKLYRGQDNAAGEIGHICLNEKGPRCNCGSSACLEAYIGNNRIIKEARRLFKRNISLEELSLKARKQNKLALAIWGKVGMRLGLALSSVVNLLNLDAIVIGGGVAKTGGILFDKVRQTLKMRAMSVQAKRVKVLKAKLGSDAGLIGAAILVKENIHS